MMDTTDLRKNIRALRQALSDPQQRAAACSLNSKLQTLKLVNDAKRIGLYLVNDGEIDPIHFMHWAWRQQKSCYLPVLNKQADAPMRFAKVLPKTQFKPNRFNIPEPVETKMLRAAELNLILMPLVAFDLKGNRVGMGGGYYDRTLAFKRTQPYHQRPALIGLAHNFQYVETLEPAPWDIPLDGMVTEQQAILFGQQST